jgi:hypothetical protein
MSNLKLCEHIYPPTYKYLINLSYLHIYLLTLQHNLPATFLHYDSSAKLHTVTPLQGNLPTSHLYSLVFSLPLLPLLALSSGLTRWGYLQPGRHEYLVLRCTEMLRE